VPNLLTAISDSGLLANEAWVILRHPIATDYERRLGKLRPIKNRTYGTMRFTWFRYDQELT
jgi:16S rRNA G966 N2-methylase RsmD